MPEWDATILIPERISMKKTTLKGFLFFPVGPQKAVSSKHPAEQYILLIKKQIIWLLIILTANH